jgi:hypothetical protein
MTFRRLMIACGVAALFLGGAQAHAQRPPVGTRMLVLVKFQNGQEPWRVAPLIASATGMQLVGVSASTNSAVYWVANETNYEQGTVAARHYKTISDGFPGAVMSYNYGPNYPTPADLTSQAPYDARRDEMPRRGGRPGNAYGSTRLSARDRMAARDWYTQTRDVGSRLQPGMVLDANLQLQTYAAPNDLVRLLPRVQAGSRYLILGNQLLLVDGRNYILDVVQFDSGR